MTARLHYAIETDMFGERETVACCGNDFRRTKKLTDDPELVTCRECLTLCGFDPVPIDQLTETVAPPVLKRAA